MREQLLKAIKFFSNGERDTDIDIQDSERKIIHVFFHDYSTIKSLRLLRAEIIRRRKENHDALNRRKWCPEAISKREQSELLNWIERQLDMIPNN